MEKKYMERALELAKLGANKVSPNPMVGAVVVKNGEIIGEGYHKKFGDSHAEVYALEEAGERAEGATIYITLEPCSHYGKTPPCALKLVKSKIKKCVIAMKDPNPVVQGNGIAILKEAGIEVEVGLLEKEAIDLNRKYIKYIKTKKPFLFIKCGITLDGKLATRTGSSKWITNDLSREKVQKLREKYMSIMVGINTVIVDNPSLNVRLEDGQDPFRIVIDPNLKIPLESKLLMFEDGKNIIVSSKENKNSEKALELKKLGVQLIYLDGFDFKIDDILVEIGKLGIDSILLEGGGYLISKAFGEDAYDAGEIFIAAKIIGDSEAVPFISGFSFENISSVFELKNVKANIYGDNVSIEFSK